MKSEAMTVSESDFVSVRFPTCDENPNQDEEWCFVDMKNGDTRKIRFHDYQEVFSVEGLYEHLFYEKLECDSPRTVVDLLSTQVDSEGFQLSDLNVLDVGAGNGMVGEALTRVGVETVVGLDIIDEAREATHRDRPGIYDRYYIEDLTSLENGDVEKYQNYGLNCLTIVAALGFGDIPPLAFANAFNLIEDGGWIVFNIKDEFLQSEKDSSGFSRLVKYMCEKGNLEKQTQEKYRHRLSIEGVPLYYHAIVAKKKRDIQLSELDKIQ